MHAAVKAVVDAETSLTDAELAAETAAVGTDDEALKVALLDAANDNRVAEYGDDYIDQEMMGWGQGSARRRRCLRQDRRGPRDSGTRKRMACQQSRSRSGSGPQ
jgi:hypothetical protein